MAKDRGRKAPNKKNIASGTPFSIPPSLALKAGLAFASLLALRLLAAAVIGAGAAWVVLARRPRESARSMVRGRAAAALLVVVVGGAWGLRSFAISLGPVVTTLAALAAAVIALGLFANLG